MPFTTNKQVMITTPNRLHFYQKKPLGIDASVQHRSYGSKPRCRDPVSLHIGEETTESSTTSSANAYSHPKDPLVFLPASTFKGLWANLNSRQQALYDI